MIVYGILVIHLVGAEFIKIHAHGLPMLFNILFPEFGHFFHFFIFCENRFGDASGGVINRGEEAMLSAPLFKPFVV